MSNLIVSDFKTGFENDKAPFLLNNDAFPVLNNAYIFENSVRRKRGNSLLNRLRRDLTGDSLGSTNGSGVLSINVITQLGLETDSELVPGSLTIHIVTVADLLESVPPDGELDNGAGATATINYASGALVITGGPASQAVTLDYSYYPSLPVLGLEDFDVNVSEFPTLVLFDSKYSYQVNNSTEAFYDTTFYKHTKEPFNWNNASYQQFFSSSYEDSLFVTNNRPGMHFKAITGAVGADPISTFTIVGHGLSNNDYVFINEVGGITGVNGVSGRVTVVDPDNFTIPTPGAAGAYTTGGIAQYLTRSVSSSVDGIRFYTGDPTAAAAPDNEGWVNFAPPLSLYDETNNPRPEYLVGAQLLIPFKDRLLFFNVQKSTSAGSVGSSTIHESLMVYSQNGTPYYSIGPTADYATDFQAWFRNIPAKGGDLLSGVDQAIYSVEKDKDILLCGFEGSKTKLNYTGDDSFPFFYQTINSKLGTFSPSSSVQLDKGMLDIGPFGFIFTSSNSADRFDQKIKDEVFDISPLDFGDFRLTSFKDYRNEFIYFTYLPKGRSNEQGFNFPNKVLLYNYIDGNWASLDENYTHYGFYRKVSSYTWSTLPFRSWQSWTNPWNYGGIGERYPAIIGGNQQGFIMLFNEGVANDKSQFVKNVSGTTVTSTDHCLSEGEYIQFDDTFTPSSNLNGRMSLIVSVTNSNTFEIDLAYDGTFIGGISYRRIQNYTVKTKAFPINWQGGRQTRIGVQRYLFENSPNGQTTIQLFTSQTQTEDSNIFPFNTYPNTISLGPNSQFPLQTASDRLWHRMNNSFIGDTVQVGFKMSNEQLINPLITDAEFQLHAFVLTLHPAGLL